MSASRSTKKACAGFNQHKPTLFASHQRVSIRRLASDERNAGRWGPFCQVTKENLNIGNGRLMLLPTCTSFVSGGHHGLGAGVGELKPFTVMSWLTSPRRTKRYGFLPIYNFILASVGKSKSALRLSQSAKVDECSMPASSRQPCVGGSRT